MPATSADVARRAGVSRATVSQVLNGHADRFAPETVEKVRTAASELEYQPSAAGRALRRGSSNVIIALLPDTTFGTNLQDLFEPMSEALAAHDYMLVLRTSTTVPGSFDRLVRSMRPAAIFSLSELTDAEREVVRRREVIAFAPADTPELDHNFEIGALQARTILAHGYTRLAYAHLIDTRREVYGASREAGFRAVASEYRLDVRSIATEIDIDSAAAALASLPDRGYGIACYNDDVALSLLSGARSLGLTVPGDFGLMGMDNTRHAGIALPRITTIEYDLAAAARHATDALLHVLGGGNLTPEMMPTELTLVPGGTL